MKMKIALLSSVMILLSGCEYKDQFDGMYNGRQTLLSVYSKNIKKQCVELTFTAYGADTQHISVSAKSFTNLSDPLASSSFNTKNESCGAKTTNYIEGTRKIRIVSSMQTGSPQPVGYGYCQDVYYNRYEYQEVLSFDLKDSTTDQVVGSFSGDSPVRTILDTAYPAGYGMMYYCGRRGYPYSLPPVRVRTFN